jgi:hypothetical protein
MFKLKINSIEELECLIHCIDLIEFITGISFTIILKEDYE